MLGREPQSDKELLMVYSGILAHGTSMSAAETARMIPQLSAATVRQAMRWAGDERQLAEASAAVLAYMRQPDCYDLGSLGSGDLRGQLGLKPSSDPLGSVGSVCWPPFTAVTPAPSA